VYSCSPQAGLSWKCKDDDDDDDDDDKQRLMSALDVSDQALLHHSRHAALLSEPFVDVPFGQGRHVEPPAEYVSTGQ
jgi:hypothetical protein